MSSRSNQNNLVPASPARTSRAPAPKGDLDAPPTSEGRYAAPVTTGCDDDLSLPQGKRDAPPASTGRYAMPATPGRDDESANTSNRCLSLLPQRSSSTTIRESKSPASESASTIRRAPPKRTTLGAPQIDSIVKARYAKRASKKLASFATVLETERDKTPTPVDMLSSARSTDTGSFEILRPAKQHARKGAVSEDSA